MNFIIRKITLYKIRKLHEKLNEEQYFLKVNGTKIPNIRWRCDNTKLKVDALQRVLWILEEEEKDSILK